MLLASGRRSHRSATQTPARAITAPAGATAATRAATVAWCRFFHATASVYAATVVVGTIRGIVEYKVKAATLEIIDMVRRCVIMIMNGRRLAALLQDSLAFVCVRVGALFGRRGGRRWRGQNGGRRRRYERGGGVRLCRFGFRVGLDNEKKIKVISVLKSTLFCIEVALFVGSFILTIFLAQLNRA